MLLTLLKLHAHSYDGFLFGSLSTQTILSFFFRLRFQLGRVHVHFETAHPKQHVIELHAEYAVEEYFFLSLMQDVYVHGALAWLEQLLRLFLDLINGVVQLQTVAAGSVKVAFARLFVLLTVGRVRGLGAAVLLIIFIVALNFSGVHERIDLDSFILLLGFTCELQSNATLARYERVVW